jgi:hypothetical protein
MDNYLLEWHKPEEKRPENGCTCICLYNTSTNGSRYAIHKYKNGVWYDWEYDFLPPIYWAKLPDLK